jgi:hypothetical protein
MCVPWITRNLSVFSPCPCSPAFLRLRVGVAFVIPSQEARNLLLLFRALNSRLIIGSRLNWFLLSDHPITRSSDHPILAMSNLRSSGGNLRLI